MTIGGASPDAAPTTEAAVASQLADLEAELAAQGSDRSSIGRLLLDGFGDEPTLESVDAFVDVAGRYRNLGITELVVHWPMAGTQFATEPDLFERIVTEGAAQLGP